MSATWLEKLKFHIQVEDFASKTIGKISKSLHGMHDDLNRKFQNFTQGMQAGMGRIQSGAMGLMASGAGLYGFLKPVYEMQDALGEVRSLGVAESELLRLKKVASDFSIAYGTSATDFVRSSYDIQSAIAGLNQGELAKFTQASNLLAKATKADASTVTAYMGTMYGIFSEQANAMGKAQWVEQLTGQTATAVKLFKTTGAEMSSAFTSLGANAQSAGVGLSEQIAILGSLQATMSGSEAGTKYKSFLAGIGKAQDELGLSFTDSQGRMLPMLDILDKLKGKFGSTLDVAESDALKKAFGSDEAVSLVKLLMNQTDGLRTSMQRLGDVRGMEQAERMAKSMTNPWERLGAVTTDLRRSFGELLLPTINTLLTKMNNGLATLKGWSEEYPNIARWVGYAAVGLLGFAAAVSLGSMAMGVGQVALTGLKFALGFLTSKFLIITGVIGGVAYGAYKLWENWDAVKQSLKDGTWTTHISNFFKGVLAWFEKLIGKAKWLLEYFGVLDKDLDTQVSTKINTEHVNTHIDKQLVQTQALAPLSFSETQSLEEKPQPLAPLRMPEETPTPNKSISAQLTQSLGNQKRGAQFGDVYIQSDQAPTPELLEEWGLLQGG